MQVLDAIATHRVADRPDRFEPRLRKRRQKKYERMMKPRHEIKLAMHKGQSCDGSGTQMSLVLAPNYESNSQREDCTCGKLMFVLHEIPFRLRH